MLAATDRAPTRDREDCVSGLIDALLEARRKGAPLSDASGLLPASLADAYALQDEHLARLLEERADTVAGYKIGGTNPAMLKVLGLDEPFHGAMPAGLVHASPATLPAPQFSPCVLEVEIAFRFARALPAREQAYSDAEIADAIGHALPAIEIVVARGVVPAGPNARLLVADLAGFGALVHGAPVAAWRDIDLKTLPTKLFRDGQEAATGSGAAVMGDPFATLCRFLNVHRTRGRGIAAGQIVTTGTTTPPNPQSGPAAIRADLGPLGSVSLTLA